MWRLLFSGAFVVSCSTAAVQINDDGAWNWLQDRRAVIADGKLIVASVAAGTHAEQRAGNVEISSYDLRRQVKARFTLHKPVDQAGRKLWLNDHNCPGLWVRPDGRILTMYTLHGADERIYYRISTRAADITAWDEEQVFIPRPHSRVVFPSLVYFGSRLFAFFRGLDNRLMPAWASSDDLGGSWQLGNFLIQPPKERGAVPYPKYAAGLDAVHAGYSTGHRFDRGNGIYYTAFRPDAPMLQRPEAGRQIFQAGAGEVVYINDVQVDREGNPLIGYSVQKDAATREHRYRYARRAGANWIDREIAYAGGSLHTDKDDDCTGLMAIDPRRPGVVYISTNAEPLTGKPLPHWEIFRGQSREGHETWQWTPVTRNSAVDNIRPVLAGAGSGERALVWLRGRLVTYTDFQLEIVALPLAP